MNSIETIDKANLVKLPIKSIKAWEVLERWGLKKISDYDNRLCDAFLPDSWSVRQTHHPFWAHLVDPRGLKRASMLCNRDEAYIRIDERFKASNVYNMTQGRTEVYSIPLIKDDARNVIVHRFAPIKIAKFNKAGEEIIGALMGDYFYYEPETSYRENSSSTKISFKWRRKVESNDSFEFFTKSAARNQYPDFLPWIVYAIEYLEEDKTKEFISLFPTDDTVWNSEYDLPAA